MNYSRISAYFLGATGLCTLIVAAAGAGAQTSESGRNGAHGPAKAARPITVQGAKANIVEATIRGPEYHAPELFNGFEDVNSPLVERLRKEYRLDDVVKGETNEFRKMLKLRNWVHGRWHIDNDQKFMGDVFEILEKAKTGAGFYCTHSMRVQHAVMTAMGFVARDLGVDVNHEEFGRSIHHGVNEVWSNQYAKWVLLDAKYNIHYERAGVPLSALEIHEAVRANQAKEVVTVRGIDRTVVTAKDSEYPTNSPLSYWWVSYHTGQRQFTGTSDNRRLVIFDNAAFRETKWFRQTSNGLKESWAYKANAFVPTRDRGQIEWTPGVADVALRQISDTELAVDFSSANPNLKSYRVRTGAGSWQEITGGSFRWRVAPGENMLDVQTRNLFDVDGPLTSVTVRLR